jgi:hypothetical protein
MIRKSVKMFSEKIMLKQEAKRDDDLTRSHRALELRCEAVPPGARDCLPSQGRAFKTAAKSF